MVLLLAVVPGFIKEPNEQKQFNTLACHKRGLFQVAFTSLLLTIIKLLLKCHFTHVPLMHHEQILTENI